MSTTVKSAPIPPSRQREKPGQPLKWIGKNIKRVEDPRLLTGQGRYIDDIDLPNMLHAAVLRSTRAHARIKSIDVSAAAALKSVVKVLTGADIARATGPLPCFSNPTVEQRCVAVGRVRHVGEAVAVVVAESRYVAEDALDLIAVEYEDLPVMSDPEEAVKATGDGVLHPERGPTNVAMQRRFTFGPVEADFAGAARIVRRRLRWPRSGAQPLETVGAVAEYESGAGKFTVHMNSSMYNYVGWTMALSLGVPAHKINLVPVIAGGSFGSKLFTHKVCVLAASLARICGRPVKYIEDRIDNITSLRQSRLRPHLRHRARARRRQPDDRAALQGARRLWRLFPIRSRPSRQRAVADRRAIPHSQRRPRRHRGADQQVPARRLSWLRLRGLQLRHRADGGRGGRRARPRPGRIPAQEFHPAGGFSLQDPDRQSLRQRQLRRGARRGAAPARLCRMAQEAGGVSQAGPLYRNRHRHLPGAQRVLGDRVLDAQRGGRVCADELARGGQHQDRCPGQDRGLAERAVLGQQPRDRGDHDPGRAVEDRSGRHQHRLFRHRPRSRRNGPRRQPLYGDGRGRAGRRRRHHQGKAVPRRRPHAGSEPAAIWSCATAKSA